MATSRTSRLSRRTVLKGAGAAAGVVGVSALAAACAPAANPGSGGASDAKAVRGGTLTFANSGEIVSPDPVTSGGDSFSISAVLMLHEGLTAYTEDLEIKPRLATSWEVKENVWTFKLRQGVKFHDGTPFNAAAVKAHFERVMAPESTMKGSWTPYIDKVEAVDDATMRFTTKFPDAFFLSRLADASGTIVSPAAVAKFGKDITKNPVGTGPFKFLEWVKDERFVVVRNEEYWGAKANLDKVIIRPISDIESRAIALEAGDVQLARSLNPEHIARIEKNAKLTYILKGTTRNLFMGLHAPTKPYSDVRVRQALNYAVDKESIVKNIYLNTADVLIGPVPQGAAGYTPISGFKYDPAKAKQLLTEAGFPNGFTTTMIATKGAYPKDTELQQAVQQYARAVGVTINIEVVEFAKFITYMRAPVQTSGLQIWQDAWAGTDAAYFMGHYRCDQFRPEGFNRHGFCNPKATDLVKEAERTTDQTKRDQLLKDAAQMITDDAASLWLVAVKQIAGMSKTVHQPYFSRTGTLSVTEATWIG